MKAETEAPQQRVDARPRSPSASLQRKGAPSLPGERIARALHVEKRAGPVRDQGALAGVEGVPIAPEAAESVDIGAEAIASGAGIGAGVGVAIGAGVGGVVVVVVSTSFLLQPARAATLKESAAMKLSDRMEAPGLW